MQFDPQSPITFVITSCGRFSLLENTLKSFDEFNTYPIKEVILTEDSGNEDVFNYIPEHWKNFCKVIVNNPKLGQTPSIDLAYSQVTTPYIFHCEDDWEFYRTKFIEDSLLILESNPNILQVWLRSYYYDTRLNYSFISRTTYERIDNVGFYHVANANEKQCGFSYNPGLRRLADYQKIAPYVQYEEHEEGIESGIAEAHKQQNMFAVMLENDAVTHTGWGHHVANQTELKKFLRRKKLRIIRNIVAFAAGLAIGYLIA